MPKVLSSSVWMDGGSLGLVLDEGDRRSEFMMDRSVESLNTPLYESVHDLHGLLSADRRSELFRVLRESRRALTDTDADAYVVDEFLKVLGRA